MRWAARVPIGLPSAGQREEYAYVHVESLSQDPHVRLAQRPLAVECLRSNALAAEQFGVGKGEGAKGVTHHSSILKDDPLRPTPDRRRRSARQYPNPIAERDYLTIVIKMM